MRCSAAATSPTASRARTEIGASGEFASVPAPDAFAREELPFPEDDNVFWVHSVAGGTRMKLFGGEHGADFYVGQLGLLDNGDVSGVQGRVVLHGEDATPSSEPQFATEFDRENTLLVDARLQGDGEVGFLDDDRIWGRSMPGQVDVPTPPRRQPVRRGRRAHRR